jgi:hypothetical protein
VRKKFASGPPQVAEDQRIGEPDTVGITPAREACFVPEDDGLHKAPDVGLCMQALGIEAALATPKPE